VFTAIPSINPPTGTVDAALALATALGALPARAQTTELDLEDTPTTVYFGGGGEGERGIAATVRVAGAESGRIAFFGVSVATTLGLLAAEQLTVAERVSVVAGAAGAEAADPEDGRRALAGFGEASGRPATRR
jgi:hypothetical protein